MAKRQGIMLCYPFEEARLQKWGFPVIVQAKLDGERCRSVPNVHLGEVDLLSSTEQYINSVPHINEEIKQLYTLDGGYYLNEYDGELYAHGMSFDDISSRVSRTVNRHSDSASIQYHIFDVVDSRPQHMRAKLMVHLQQLTTQLGILPHIKFVPTAEARGMEEVINLLELFINAGYEGIIIRNYNARYERKRSTNIMKFKPRKSDVYEVTDRVEEIDKNGVPKGSLGALVCRGDDGTLFNVGSGFTQAQRHELWHGKLPKKIEVLYQHITKNHVPRFPVYFRVVED